MLRSLRFDAVLQSFAISLSTHSGVEIKRVVLLGRCIHSVSSGYLAHLAAAAIFDWNLLFRWTGMLWHEVVELSKLAAPIAAAQLCFLGLLFVNLLMLGRISAEALGVRCALFSHCALLAAGSLAMTFTSITGVYTGQGLTSAFDTLSVQSFGAQNYKVSCVAT